MFRKFFSAGRTWWCLASVAVLAIIAFAYFSPDVTEGNVLLQHDMQQGLANQQEVSRFAETTGETSWWTDALFGGMPTFQISPVYSSNKWFGWINTVMGLGLPSPANLLVMMMLGMFILLLAMRMRWWVALIGAIGYGFSSYFVIIIGAGHIWKFVTLTYIPPTIAGVVLCYRGRYLWGAALAALFAMMQIAANHVQMTYYFLFVTLGFVVAFLIDAVRRKRLKQWGIATGCLVVAAVLAVAANLPSLYYTYSYAKETMRGGHSELTSPNASEAQADGLNLDYITQYSYQPSETFSLLIPNVKGGATMKPEKGSMKMMSIADTEAFKQLNDERLGREEQLYFNTMAPYLTQYFGDPEGTNGPVYVGALICALFLTGCFICRGPLKWILLGLTLLSVGLAWGRHMMWLTEAAVNWLPMYNKFRTVESILVIAEFTMPLLAAMALQRLVTAGDYAWKRYGKTVCWTFGVTAAICLIGVVAPSFFGSGVTDTDRMIDAQFTQQLMAAGYPASEVSVFSLNNPTIYSTLEHVRYALVRSDALRSLMMVLFGGLFLLLWMKRRLPAWAAIGVVGVLILGDLFFVNKRYLDHESFAPAPRGERIPMTATDRLILQDTTMNYRVLDFDRFSQPEPSYYHKSVGGYHAAKLTRYNDLIERHLNNFVYGQAPTAADTAVVNMLNAKYMIWQGQAGLNPEAFGNAWLVDRVEYVDGADAEMEGLSRYDLRRNAVADKQFSQVLGASQSITPGDTIYETSYAPNRLTYKTRSAKGGVAVFSEIWFPWGWTATIDGKEAELGRANYVLRAMQIPAGEHTIEMVFQPTSLTTLTSVAKAAVTSIYLLFIGALVWMATGARKDDKEVVAQ